LQPYASVRQWRSAARISRCARPDASVFRAKAYLGSQALPRLYQHVLHVGGGTRAAEQIALRLRATLLAQEIELRIGLDTFSPW
jgi:hypothetical protein